MTEPEQWEFSSEEIREITPFLVKYLRHPLHVIRQVPNWRWPTILLMWTGLLMLSGSLSGLFTRKLFDFIAGLLIFPLSGTLMTAITAAFFYYAFHLFLQREVSYRRLYLVIVLASVPFLIFRIPVSVLPPSDLVGLAFSALLVIVGCTDNFQLPRQFISRLVAGLYAVFLVFWIYSQISLYQSASHHKIDVTPESYDKLEKELNESN